MSKYYPKFYNKCMCLFRDRETIFIKYDNIYSVGKPVKNNGLWTVNITCVTKCSESLGHVFHFAKIEEAEKGYNNIVEKCLKYHTKRKKNDE